jgi:hypothetical protein
MESEKRTTVSEEEAQVDESKNETDRDVRPSTADSAAGVDQDRESEDEARESREGTDLAGREPLLDQDATTNVRGRWETIQASFVDEPRHAVEEADALVADLMQRLAESFADERQALEGQWDRGDEVSTEDLRVALQRYRSFFDRLLSA